MIYYYFLYYRVAFGECVARLWLHDVIDFWYTEDMEVVNKYNGLNQFKLWDYGKCNR